MKPIIIEFSKGVQFPPTLGTLKLRPASEGRAAYAQNIDIASDEYGNGAVVPGAALTTITNNSQLTGVPFVKAFYGDNVSPLGYLYFGEGVLGSKLQIRRIKNIISGQTPIIDTTVSMDVTHSAHANSAIVDMVFRPDVGTSTGQSIYVAGKDDTDTWVQKFAAGLASPSLSVIATNSGFTGSYTNQFLVYSSFDNNIYWIGKNRVDSIDSADAYTASKLALGLPLGSYATCGADWQQQLVIAYSDEAFGDFDLRKSAGRAGIVTWDYVSPAITRNVPAPCRYISALVPTPSGQLLAFGGIDRGKTSLYLFNGYGFDLVYQYIGDMPRSRHSVDFDDQGRVVWQTVDGQLCRFDFGSKNFEHLASITTGSSAGGILAKGIGSPAGNDLFVASGSGSSYSMKIAQFGSYIGDGDAASDTIMTPLVVSGIQVLPPSSNIQSITVNLAKSLVQGEKIQVRLYKNGSTTYEEYMTLDYSVDGAISSKALTLTKDEINSFSLGIAWKMADGAATVPPVLSVEVEIGTQYGN